MKIDLSAIRAIIILGCLALSGQERPVGRGEIISELVDLKNWDSPVKSVFKKYKLPLTKVVFYGADKYPVFYTSIPFDPMTQPNARPLKRLELEILVANDNKSYSIYDDRNRMRIEVTVDNRDKNIVRTNIVILEGGEQDF